MKKWYSSFKIANSPNNNFHKKNTLELNSRIKALRKNNKIKLKLRLNSPQIINNKLELNRILFENSSKENLTDNINAINLYKKNYKINDIKYDSFSSGTYSNNNIQTSSYNNKFFLDELLNKEIQKKEEKTKKMKKKLLQKVNAFLFNKKNNNDLLGMNKNNNKNEMKKTFSSSTFGNKSYINDNESFIKKSIKENYYCIRKNLFPKTKKDNKFRKIKYVGDLLRNNNYVFKRSLLKQRENSEKLLFDIRKAQSNEIKNIQLGLALLRTKHKVYKCDKLLKYKYN